ncbi:MAG: ferredoxin [Alphaproteobacteria bacterium]|nr:ferredoxin [Alphaproteobacteria bacterium]
MIGTWTGRKTLVTLLASFGVVFAVNGYFVTEALKTFSGGEDQHPYLQGLEFNQTLARHAEQAGLGWRASLDVVRAPTGAAEVVVSVADRAGRPLSGLKLTGELRHPTNSARDHALTFADEGSGRYVAETKGLTSGAWEAHIASASGDPFEATRRLWLR